ncbi:DUF6311 domain-containing protein [Flavobacterium sp.]|uniref:DUF6311 domain-containing protein n=1 Tax=Flavobacterium sp. TaxID=239 RepID=UPI0026322879|nr:DUF6311 domain-containing protein [Flavobacterium sp.]MDD3004336.1 DUF6311 domain-containing protein [Flavobacterium sp.]
MYTQHKLKYFLISNNLNIFLFVITLVFFYICYGLAIVNPTNINWLMSAYHDWGQHYLGWAFYRNDPWSFPLGTIESYNYPVGTNIGFTDSIPLLGLLLKPFSAFLPEDFQYIGFWLLLCYFLAAIYTGKILKLYTSNKLIIIGAVLIVITNPVLLFRTIHPALSAHFLILGSIYNYLRPSIDQSKRINYHQIILFLISSALNPYIAAMIFGFNIIVPLKHFFIDKSICLKKLILYPVVSIVSFLSYWIVLGMIEFNTPTSVASVEPFSVYSLNLNSFWDSYGYYSKILPDLGRLDPRQYEGFAYLGIGMIIFTIFNAMYLIYGSIKGKINNKFYKKWSLLLLLCILMLLFAITNVWTFGTNVIATLPLPKIIEKIGFIFRASGRFVWPMYYLILIGCFIIITKIKVPNIYKSVIIIALTLLQLYDIQELYNRWNFTSGTFKTKLQDEKWIAVMKNFEDIIIYPPFDYNYSINYNNDYQDLSYLALKANKPISNGYVARANVIKAQNFNSQLGIELSSGKINPKRLFITTIKHLNSFDKLLNKQIVDIHLMDDFVFIYTKNTALESRNFNENFKTKVFLDSVKTYYKNIKIPDFEEINYPLNTQPATKYFFDSYLYKDPILHVRGWAILEETNNNSKDKIYLILKKENQNYELLLKPEKRTDITTAFKKENLDNAGFQSTINTNTLPKGSYSVGLVIKNQNQGNVYIKTDKNINIK